MSNFFRKSVEELNEDELFYFDNSFYPRMSSSCEDFKTFLDQLKFIRDKCEKHFSCYRVCELVQERDAQWLRVIDSLTVEQIKKYYESMRGGK